MQGQYIAKTLLASAFLSKKIRSFVANCMAYGGKCPISMGNNGNSWSVGSLLRYAARTTPRRPQFYGHAPRMARALCPNLLEAAHRYDVAALFL